MAFVPTPCPSCGSGGGAGSGVGASAVVLCDDNGPFLRQFTYTDGAVSDVADTELDGVTPYVVVGDVVLCGAGGAADAPVSSGIRRISGATPLNLVTLHPGLQSATITVLAGNVTATTSDGSAALPTGSALTWSVADTDDSSLAALSFVGDASADYLVAFTYKAGAEG